MIGKEGVSNLEDDLRPVDWDEVRAVDGINRHGGCGFRYVAYVEF